MGVARPRHRCRPTGSGSRTSSTASTRRTSSDSAASPATRPSPSSTGRPPRSPATRSGSPTRSASRRRNAIDSRKTRSRFTTRSAFRNLATGATEIVKDVTQFRFSGDGRFLAMRRYPAEGKRSADLIVQDLEHGTKMTFGNVSEFAWSERARVARVHRGRDGGRGQWRATLRRERPATTRVLDSSPSLYRMLAWREKSEDLAVLRSRTDKEFRDTTHVVIAWTRVSGTQRPAARARSGEGERLPGRDARRGASASGVGEGWVDRVRRPATS